MKLCIVQVLALGCLAPVFAQEPRVTEEMKKLQGTWVRIYVVADGNKTEDDKKAPDKEVILKITGDSYDGEKYSLDPTKTPKHINVADDKGKTLPGIYELKDGELKLCFPFPFEGKLDGLGKRPADFDVKAGSNNVVEVYKKK